MQIAITTTTRILIATTITSIILMGFLLISQINLLASQRISMGIVITTRAVKATIGLAANCQQTAVTTTNTITTIASKQISRKNRNHSYNINNSHSSSNNNNSLIHWTHSSSNSSNNKDNSTTNNSQAVQVWLPLSIPIAFTGNKHNNNNSKCNI